MKKAFLVILTVSLFGAYANGQTLKVAAGPALSAPIGNLGDINSIGIGAEVTGILEFSEKFQAFGQIGYHNFLPKDIGGFRTESTSHIPILLGGRYNSNGFLIGAGIGYSTYNDLSGFTISPQLGYSLEKFDLMGHFTSTSINGASLSYLGVKLFYKF